MVNPPEVFYYISTDFPAAEETKKSRMTCILPASPNALGTIARTCTCDLVPHGTGSKQ